MLKDNERGFERNSIQVYLDEISRYPLLDKEQEYQLWTDMVPGRELREYIEQDQGIETDNPALIRDKLEGWYGDVVSAEELTYMLDTLDVYLLARETFINSNLRLVVSVAKQQRQGRMPFLDMVNEGNMGLMLAVDKFDASKGFKFSTYASWWIRQGIQRASYNQDYTLPMRVPPQHHDTLASYLRTVIDLPSVSGVDGFDRVDEIEKMSGFDAKKQADAVALYEVMTRSLSLDRPSSDDGDWNLYQVMGVEDDYKSVDQSMVIDRLLSLAESVLSEDEMQALMGRFGLIDGRPMSFDALSVCMGVGVSTAKSLYRKAYSKLESATYVAGWDWFDVAYDSD